MKTPQKILRPFNSNYLSAMLLILGVFLFISGCASVQTKEMALQSGDDKINLNKGSVCLLSIKTDNQFKPEWPPEVWGLELTDQATNKKIDIAVQSKSLGSLIKKGMSDTFTYKKDSSSWEGLISFQLPPGSYRLTAVRGGCTRGVGIAAAMASFDFPFDIPFQVHYNECVYLGRIEMINRERKSEDEIPSGDTTITRLQQKHSGFGTGTFDVKIIDIFDQDMQQFKGKYPAIGKQEVAKRIIPQWQKPNRN